MANFVPRFRFLGLTIFASVLLLSVKIGSIWEDVSSILQGALAVSKVEAQQPGGADQGAVPATQPVVLPGIQPPPTRPVALPGVQPPAATTPQPSAAAASGAQIIRPNPPAQPAAAAQPPAAASSPERTVAKFITDDPTLLSQSEIDLLQQLAERRDRLDARERELDQRVGLLQAAEQRIDRKVAEMKTLQTTIEGLLKTHQTEENAKLASMVKVYETMKPKEAARIFQELDMDTLLRVIERMKERSLAPILASMNPDKAKQVTTELTRLRQLPKPGT